MMAATASDPRKFVRSASLTFALYVLVIMISSVTMVNSANAVGTVAPSAPLWCSNPSFTSTCVYQTKEEACIALIGNRTDVYFGYLVYYAGGEAPGWTCWAYNATYPGNLVFAGRFGWIGSMAVCPANSNGTNTCTCNAGFEPDSTATSCVAENSCPANMSGSPCACIPGGYVPNPNGAGCVEEQYFISEPRDQQTQLPDMEPGSSQGIAVRVTSFQTGLPKEGAVVRFHLDVDLTSGGHVHGETYGLRPRGTIIGNNCVPEASGTPDTYDCTTGTEGYAGFTFGAPDVSGKHTITATCVSHACSDSKTTKVNVMVPNLIKIPETPLLYTLIGAIEGKHTDNHYLTPEAVDILWGMAADYKMDHTFWQFNVRGTKMQAPPPLGFNDASLIWGGKFDLSGKWSGYHYEHDRGVAIDIRANGASGAVPEPLFTSFAKLATKQNIKAVLECTSNKIDGQGRTPENGCIGKDGSFDQNRHYHVRIY
jgi:hypothetical protein